MKSQLIGIVLIVCGAASLRAQIRYTDVSPDTVLLGTSSSPWAMYDLDINGDGTPDFNITQFHPAEGMDIAEMNCSQYQQSEVLVDGAGVPRRLAHGDPVEAGVSAWFDSGASAMHMSANWRGATDGYLGLRVRKDGAWYYGWARLDVAANERTVTVKDFAAEMTTDAGIMAGARSSTGIEPSVPDQAIVFRVAGKTLMIEQRTRNVLAELTVCDMSGRVRFHQTFSGECCAVDLSGIQSGAYVLAFRSGGAVCVEKMLILPTGAIGL